MQQNPKTLDEAFSLITQELLQVFLKKHQDYGKGNILAVKELGIAMRVSEKVERLKHLLLKEELQQLEIANESIEDNWTDIAVYAIIAQMYRRGQFQHLDISTNKAIKTSS